MALGWAEFQRAMDGCEGVVRRVPDDRWDSPSPCERWSARDVADHLIMEIRWGADLVVAGDEPSDSVSSDSVSSGTGPQSDPNQDQRLVAAWHSARSHLEEVCTPDVLDRRVQWPFGEQSVDRGLGLFSLEVLVHTWDIASATDLSVTLDPGLVHDHYVRIQRVGHLLRGPGMYGPERPALPDADEQVRLLAFLGRQVS